MAKVSVIIPAAGAGKRFASATNKIFQRIGGKPIFIRTLSMFNSRDDVCQVQLVVSAADMDDMLSRFGANLGLMGVDVPLPRTGQVFYFRSLREGAPIRFEAAKTSPTPEGSGFAIIVLLLSAAGVVVIALRARKNAA